MDYKTIINDEMTGSGDDKDYVLGLIEKLKEENAELKKENEELEKRWDEHTDDIVETYFANSGNADITQKELDNLTEYAERLTKEIKELKELVEGLQMDTEIKETTYSNDDLFDLISNEGFDEDVFNEEDEEFDIEDFIKNVRSKFDELEQNYKLLQDEFDDLEIEHQNQEEELEATLKDLKLIFHVDTNNMPECTKELLKKSTKAEKWEKLKAAIKEGYAEDEDDCGDFNIWDFLGDELGLEPSGEEKEAVMYIHGGCIITDRTATHE